MIQSPVRGGNAGAYGALAHAPATRRAAGALVARAVVMKVGLTVERLEKTALVIVDAQAVVELRGAAHDREVVVQKLNGAVARLAEVLDDLERIGGVVAAERGVEQQAVLQNVVVFSRLDVAGAGGVIGVFVFQCVDDADCSGIAALLVGQDGAGMGGHHAVLGLQALVQAALLALRPGALDVAVERGRRDLVEREPAGHLGVFVEAEAGVRLKGVDGVAVEEVAVGIKGGGGVEKWCRVTYGSTPWARQLAKRLW